MNPGVVRQLTDQEIVMAAAEHNMPLPLDTDQALLLGFEYTDEKTAAHYTAGNKRRGYDVRGPFLRGGKHCSLVLVSWSQP